MMDWFRKKNDFPIEELYEGYDAVVRPEPNGFYDAMATVGDFQSKGYHDRPNSCLVEIPNTVGLKSADLEALASGDASYPDIRVVGGYTRDMMKGMRYPNNIKCCQTATYSLRELTDIVAGMEKIESYINPKWTEGQKAIYLFGVLKNVFPYDKRGEKSVLTRPTHFSNLQPLSLDEGCGATSLSYALMYKELCDRQGINCMMVNGVMKSNVGSVAHAWNLVTIDSGTYLVDLQQANANISYIDRNGEYVSEGKSNYDYFAYTGDRLSAYKSATGMEDYNNVACLPGMVKHLLENSVQPRVQDAVTEISSKSLEVTKDDAEM